MTRLSLESMTVGNWMLVAGTALYLVVGGELLRRAAPEVREPSRPFGLHASAYGVILLVWPLVVTARWIQRRHRR